jgi:hypothetical protein
MAALGRPRTCECGTCKKCKQREYMRGWYQKHREPIKSETCGMCGKTFIPRTNRPRKWCSATCKQRATYWRHHSKEGNTCQSCGKDISDRRRDTKWCSDACSRAGRPQHREIVQRSKLKTQYGMTLDDYDAMLERQGGGCAICGTTEIRGNGKRQSIDHCHDSNRVRGILCGNCNRGLGYFDHDPDVLAAAANYLKGS